MKTSLGYGLIGCGGFGRFCLEQYRSIPGLHCLGVADLDPELAHRTAQQFAVTAFPSPEALLAAPEIDLVHLATPPVTHRPLGLAALGAGKHVLCEKPLAIELADAQAMVALSQERRRLLAVNLIMRYNPLCEIVKTIVERGFLGKFLHGHFVNDAKDEPLAPGHWFWDRAQSGGIFIEHGVHFFDLFEWWFGPGKVLAAQQVTRPGATLVEQVNCTVLYDGSALVNFYHGFHQATRRDHQEWKLVFEQGSIAMSEWVPTSLQLDFLADESTLQALSTLLPTAQIQEIERYTGEARHLHSRHQARTVDGHYILTSAPGMAKMELYGHMLRALMTDQLAAIRSPDHLRRISETNGVASLAIAVTAQNMADHI